MERTPHAATTSLREIARRLANQRLDRVVAGYGERQASLRRVAFLAVVALWTLWWARLAGPPSQDNTLPLEAARLLPWTPLLLWLAVSWAIGIRRRWIPEGDRSDTAGAMANVLGIGLMLHLAWNISISMIAVLPFTTILVGARLGRRAFLACMASTVLVVGLAAPAGYWAVRPAFIPFALLLLCGLPMTVNRLLALLAEVSQAALASRDAQGRFLATMSHELRTPLNTVIHASSLIEVERLSAEDRDSLRAVQANARSLLQRVNDVLDVAALNAGRFGLAREPLVLRQVVRQAFDMMKPLADRKRLAMALHDDSTPGLIALGDAGRLEQVLTNLLGNAIKFTPEGGEVTLHARCDERWIVIEVADSGPGIAAADRERIFDAFVQASSGHARRTDGVGLGLHIVQGFARHSGGSIEVRERAGGGSVFRLVLPLEPAPAGTPLPGDADTIGLLEAHRRRCPPRHCLVVDDHAANRQVLTRLLERAGHRVTTAHNGGDVLARLRRGEGFDLVLLDLHMPDMSGLDVMAALADALPHPPRVVMLSADADAEVVRRALSMGAAGYLTKPIALDQLLATVAGADGAGPAGSASRPAGGEGRISIDLLRALAPADEVRRYILLGQRELARLDGLLEACGDGADAGGLLHDLKNVFLAIGDGPGESLCSELRDAIRRGSGEAAARARLRRHVRDAIEGLRQQLEAVSP
ncbi:MAG: response regulator [Xanthomonadaceae bacterium]|nr:response regulator [Xanthomonadaceae bacterium]MDE1965048.1 response regulator [Xanthomonadaceae bacterium]